MAWKKLGNIFNPAGHNWINSHAQVPTALVMGDIIRIYYAARDDEGKSYPVFIDVSADEPTKILHIEKEPVLTRGKPGTFDDDGVMPGYVTSVDDNIFMYYSGWNAKVSTPYHNATGLAVSRDGVKFARVYEGPVMDRSPTEPYLAVTPSMLFENNQWKAWYISGIRWDLVNGKYEPVYVIKYATSEDGVTWNRPPELCIAQRHEQEAFSHPSVINFNDQYHMWYCFRDSKNYRGGTGSYRMGYATSDDGVNWDRKDDQAGIDVSDSGWDSEMVCYPYIVEAKDRKYMFYNGNGFGQTGIGVALWYEG
jgi:predicted GH43/DUF377 family glycosyl hydrolase